MPDRDSLPNDFEQDREVTERKLHERAVQESAAEQALLLAHSDTVRPIGGAVEIQAETTRLVVEHLSVDRSMYGEVYGDRGSETGIVRGQYVRPAGDGEAAIAPFPDTFSFEDYGEHRMAARYRGELLVQPDIKADPDADAEERASWAAAGVRSAVVVPLVKDGRLVAELGVHCITPRAWTEAELSLLREVAERTWAAAERARAEEALRVSEEKYRTVFDSIDEGFCIVEVLFDADGEPVDLFHLEANAAYERHTGVHGIVGKCARDFVPDLGPWLDFYGKVAETGKAARIESHLAAPLDRWIAANASRVGGEGSHRVAIVFSDITDRKRAEAVLRESEERQAFLLALSDGLRAEPDADAMALLALRSLVEKLELDRCYIAEYCLDEDRGDILYQIGNDRVPSFPDSVRLSDFPKAFQIALGRTLVVDDVAGTAFLSEGDKRNMHALGMGAFVTAAARKGENFPLFTIVAVSGSPRTWTPDEIALLEEVNERTWMALERARGEAALAASEKKYRSLFATMGQGYCELELIRDEQGRAIDQLYLELNPAFERLFGVAVTNAKGRRASEIFPYVDPAWTETFDEVVRTGTHKQFENQHGARGAWYEVSVYPGGGDRVVMLYEDITDRKRAEEQLRESEERQAFLLALGDEIRAHASAEQKIAAASRLLGEKLGASRVIYAEYDWDRKVAEIFGGWFAPRAQAFPTVMQLDSYDGEVLSDLRAGRTVRVEDVGALVEEPAYAAIAAVGVQALLSVPLLVDGTLKVNVSIHQHEPRQWTTEEVSLVTDVAERLWAEVIGARAEAALRESEQRYRALFESMDEAYAVVEVLKDEAGAWSDFRFLNVNPAFMVHTGMPYPVGKTATELLGTPNPRWVELYGEALDTGETMRVEESEETLGITFDLNIFTLDREQNRVAVLFTNITERKQSEIALCESEERLRRIVGSATDYAIFATDPEGVITDGRAVSPFCRRQARSPARR